MSTTDAPDLDGVLLTNLADLEAAFQRLAVIDGAVFAQIDELVCDWAAEREWDGGFAFNDDELWLAPPAWRDGDGEDWRPGVWFALEAGPGDNWDQTPQADRFGVSRLTREGQGLLGFRLDQQLGRKPAWKALIRSKAAVLHDLGFRIDTLGAPFLDVRISTADLAAAARNGRYDEAMGPVEDALKIIGEAEPVLTRLIDEFRSTR